MSAIAVVREKETGSIANFRSTPITKFEFLFGKQLPYVAVAMVSFVSCDPVRSSCSAVPVKGSPGVLIAGHSVLCGGDDRVRTTDLVLHAHAGRGGFRHLPSCRSFRR